MVRYHRLHLRILSGSKDLTNQCHTTEDHLHYEIIIHCDSIIRSEINVIRYNVALGYQLIIHGRLIKNCNRIYYSIKNNPVILKY